jgi:hypothetical protein
MSIFLSHRGRFTPSKKHKILINRTFSLARNHPVGPLVEASGVGMTREGPCDCPLLLFMPRIYATRQGKNGKRSGYITFSFGFHKFFLWN